MATPRPTLGDHWREQFLAGVAWVHALKGIPGSGLRPKSEPGPDSVARILQEVAEGRYQPTAHFQAGGPLGPPVVARPPALAPHEEYILFGLNALTARGEFVSLTTGGLAFEDPAWALLAAYAISRKDKPQVAIPRARDGNDLWHRLSKVDAAIKGGAFKPEDFFDPILGWVPPATQPKFELLTVSGEQVQALRAQGQQALKVARPPRYFELYQPHAGD